MNPEPCAAPVLSIVVLAWNQAPLTQRCVASLRAHTRTPNEVIVVDNGSRPPGPDTAREVADVAVLHPRNMGFAAGMNAGLAQARGSLIAFVNNDTELPQDWDLPLVEDLSRPASGIVVPAVSNAGNRVGVRSEPGTTIITLPPFRAVPSGVVYLLRTAVARELGGWDERYWPAGAEDADLCFQVWVNGLDVVLDERVVVRHVGKASAAQLPDQAATWAANRKRLLRKWRGGEPVTTLPGVDARAAEVRRRQARLVAWSMTLYFATVGHLPPAVRQVLLPPLRRLAVAVSAADSTRRSS